MMTSLQYSHAERAYFPNLFFFLSEIHCVCTLHTLCISIFFLGNYKKKLQVATDLRDWHMYRVLTENQIKKDEVLLGEILLDWL